MLRTCILSLFTILATRSLSGGAGYWVPADWLLANLAATTPEVSPRRNFHPRGGFRKSCFQPVKSLQATVLSLSQGLQGHFNIVTIIRRFDNSELYLSDP